MSRAVTAISLLLLAAVAVPALAQPARAPAAEPIPARPEQLAYGPLRFEVPQVEDYRHRLSV